jgi:hypothetical protein
MNVRIYKTTKSEEQPFIHVHILINTDHHIIEINDGNATNAFLSVDSLENAIFNGAAFDTYTFQADDEGFYVQGKVNRDIIPSGNTKCNYKYSRFILDIKDINGVRSVIITSTFNKKETITTIPIKSHINKEESFQLIKSIRSNLYSGFYEWVDECMSSCYD